jgi:hypothetical protein
MTETERERIRDTDAENQQRRYEAVSRVRRRIREELPKDVEALRQGHPELLEELRVIVGEK